MPNSDGIVLGGNSSRGFNDNTVRGYPLRLALTTRQVTDVVMYDEEILSVKGGRQVRDDQHAPMDEETRREKTRQTCALRYLDGYPDTKVIDPIKENYPACTVPLSATAPLHGGLENQILLSSTFCTWPRGAQGEKAAASSLHLKSLAW